MELNTPGERIRAARFRLPRKANGRVNSQLDLGLLCGWGVTIGSPEYRVQRYETNKGILPVKDVELLAKALGVNPEWIAFGVNPPCWAPAGDSLLAPELLPSINPAREFVS